MHSQVRASAARGVAFLPALLDSTQRGPVLQHCLQAVSIKRPRLQILLPKNKGLPPARAVYHKNERWFLIYLISKNARLHVADGTFTTATFWRQCFFRLTPRGGLI